MDTTFPYIPDEQQSSGVILLNGIWMECNNKKIN